MSEHIKSAKEKRDLTLIDSYKTVFETEPGRKVMFDLMKESGFLQVSHVQGEAHTTAFNDGQRALFLHILKRLNTKPEDIIKLTKQGEENERAAIFENVTR